MWPAVFSKSRRQILLDSIIFKYDGNEKYQKEIDFLKEQNDIVIFPYKKTKQMGDVTFGFDTDKSLPYIIHDNRRLYFTNSWDKERIITVYKDFIEVEGILGGGYSEKTPHQYQTDSFHIKKEDILLDVGCAESLFSLAAVDKVKKIYLFEADPIWFNAIEATFENELKTGKVVLIRKYVSDTNTQNTVTIDSILKNEDYESLFIKMDIEGNEPVVVKSCQNIMKTDKDIRFSCCTYHRNDDAEILESIFKQNGYYTEFSDGYMLFYRDKLIKAPISEKG